MTGPAVVKIQAYTTSCPDCGWTIGVRSKEADAQAIAEEHNRIFHPGWEAVQAISEFGPRPLEEP